MYKLPKSIDLNFLKDKELESVSIAFNSMVLNFDEPIKITVTSGCVYKANTGTVINIENYSHEATLICKLLGKKIVEANGDKSGTLTLTFDNGDYFLIYDDSEQYESYMIWGGPNGNIVV